MPNLLESITDAELTMPSIRLGLKDKVEQLGQVSLEWDGNGIQVERCWMLARDMHGKPVLWTQRQRKPLLAPPARELRFDVPEQTEITQDS